MTSHSRYIPMPTQRHHVGRAHKRSWRTISFTRARRIWAFLSLPGNERLSIRAIAERTNSHTNTVQAALDWLRELHYIDESADGRGGTRRVLVRHRGYTR